VKPIALPTPSSSSNFSSIDPLDGRYYDPEIAKYLSESSRLAYQIYVEVALGHSLAEHGICSEAVANEIEQAAAKVTIEAVSAEEKISKHDIKAVVNVLKANVSDEAKPFVHFGATSYDIVATALSLQLRDAVNFVVIPRLMSLEKTLLDLALKYADTVQIGRTHGQHAVPITFGFSVASYVSRLGQNIEALKILSASLRGKFSGAVGAYNALSLFSDDPVAFEVSLLKLLDIDPAEFSTQIIPAEYYVRLIDELNISAGIMANIGHDMRHLQRSEIGEVREAFSPGQTGSSTMAHKRNPWNFENVISMSKQVLSQIINANLNLVSEHQRDLTDSASARFYGLVLALVASMAARLDEVMQKIEVDEASMQKNLSMSRGAIAAEPLYLLLEKYGHTSAHEIARDIAIKAIDEQRSLLEVAQTDNSIADYLAKFSESENRIIAAPEKYYTGLAANRARTTHKIWTETLFA